MASTSKNPHKSEYRRKLDRLLSQFDQFTEPGVIGHYQSFELIEIFGSEKNKPPFNVLSIAVASETFECKNPEFVGDRIRVDGFTKQAFGIRRSIVSIQSLRTALDLCEEAFCWQPVDKTSNVGKLRPLERRFVTTNSLNRIALNRIVKNNFFNGSYVLEFFDVTKEHLRQFFENPEALASLSASVNEFIPIDVASVSDRLGNIVIQFPIDVVRTQFGASDTGHYVEVAWHPKSHARELTVVGSVYHDKTPVSFGCVTLSSGVTGICEGTDLGLLRGYIWDNENELLLAATDDCAFITRMSLNMQLTMHEPRVFPTSFDKDASKAQVRLRGSSQPSQIGDFEIEKISDPIQSRIYEEERQELARQRTFVQYGARGAAPDDRKRALDDLRTLISKHGAGGVWLWDPYLSSQDVLDSLFWNTNAESQMRALTLLKVAAQQTDSVSSTKIQRMHKFAKDLTDLNSNFKGLDVEFRSAHGVNGWDFHDRFLIFPVSGKTRAKAWSLGTSVNSLGKTHHILQQVDNAQLVATAFEELWNAVTQPENLIWRCP